MEVTTRLAAPPAQVVEVVVGHIPPGRRIERMTLIDPDGARYPARSLVPVTTTEGGLRSGPNVGVGVTGGSSSGINPSISLGWNITQGEAERTSRRVEAQVPIPDPAAYRANPARWRIEIEFVEIDGERRRLSFPAAHQ